MKRKWYLQRLEIQQTTHRLHINLKHTLQEWTTFYGFHVSFDCPVYLETHKQYKVQSIVDDPISWSGKQGQTFVESEGVRFTFSDAEDGTADDTSVVHGLFQAFLLS